MNTIFNGVCTALVTPFKNGKVDFGSLKNLIDYQLDGGVSAICALGTTGEPCSLTESEKKQIIKFCAQNKGGAKLIVGSGSNNTKKAIKQSLVALENGADGLLVVTPYYNRTSQNGVIEYYKQIYSATKAKIIAYNVPSRTGVNILPQTFKKLVENGYICAIKQANPSMDQTLEIFSSLRDKVNIFSGEDGLNYLFYSLGGSGAISVTANAFPELVCEVYKNYISGSTLSALNGQEALFKINRALFSEINPVPIKYCLSQLGLCKNELRLPLLPMENTSLIDEAVDILIKAQSSR